MEFQQIVKQIILKEANMSDNEQNLIDGQPVIQPDAVIQPQVQPYPTQPVEIGRTIHNDCYDYIPPSDPNVDILNEVE